ncbi:RNA polymerase sigma factor [Fodinibius sediminis]|uniref:RNA polymerase sigma-70 factor, ECF subfamily n=1 Tax=Fodinibius sediminis TaxID=1214077 RepID=A0A521EB57_9BACT|nr:sigma-70 family RNA polymerase sigma factor [Fodinibius sediminis]SMO81175.1 RNA polymerase sigma-70 factor, ECF subfamily [Fodinibius sediminis]
MLTRDQFEQLFCNYVDDVASFLYTYTSNRAKVKDWVQEVFLKMWKKRGQIDFEHPGFKSYLLKTARNHALKRLKSEKKYDLWLEENLEKLVAIQASGTSISDATEIRKAYSVALSKISKRARKAYLLSREEGLTYPEIAEVMNISIKTVESHISKALQILRSELREFNQGI